MCFTPPTATTMNNNNNSLNPTAMPFVPVMIIAPSEVSPSSYAFWPTLKSVVENYPISLAKLSQYSPFSGPSRLSYSAVVKKNFFTPNKANNNNKEQAEKKEKEEKESSSYQTKMDSMNQILQENTFTMQYLTQSLGFLCAGRLGQLHTIKCKAVTNLHHFKVLDAFSDTLYPINPFKEGRMTLCNDANAKFVKLFDRVMLAVRESETLMDLEEELCQEYMDGAVEFMCVLSENKEAARQFIVDTYAETYKVIAVDMQLEMEDEWRVIVREALLMYGQDDIVDFFDAPDDAAEKLLSLL